MDFKDLAQKRRSHRKFTAEPVDGDAVQLILRAALMAPTSKSTRAWHFYVVENKDVLDKIATCKDMGGAFVAEAPLAVVVAADANADDCWIEDCAIAAISMQYQAEDLGLGTCWAQLRGRGLAEQGLTAEQVLRPVLQVPEEQKLLCAIAIGHPADERKPQNEDKLKWENVHVE